jgi:hypothetical protein
MKASDAHTKWCPFAFVRLATKGPATNRNAYNVTDLGVCYCLGPRCAVWRGTEKDGRCGLASDKDAP